MRKVPTVFRRDPDDMRRVLPEVTDGCQWVLDGEGRALRKYDGTCCMLDDTGKWWARREVKAGKLPPEDFRSVQFDEATGKQVGWVPMAASSFAKWHAEALANGEGLDFPAGTYELCGPKVNGNPEGFTEHALIHHAEAPAIHMGALTFDGLRELVLSLADGGWEGIVWHHDDGRLAKLKGRDFRA